METMRAWVVHEPGPLDSEPLRLVTRPVPTPGPDEVLVRVECCGVCRTDLHLAEGDLPPRRPDVSPGHQVVGRVVSAGSDVAQGSEVAVGARVGVAWLRRTCGQCRWCRHGQENLCTAPEFTGWDADGGLAEYVVAPAAFTYPLLDGAPAELLAPLLCAGIIGYRALRRAELPQGGRLGLYGFGSSAHLTAQVASAQGAELYVATRDEGGRKLAERLGAVWTGGPTDRPPEALDAAIVFAPAGEIVPPALEAVGRGGVVVLAGIHMTDVPAMDYARHLFLEKVLRSVTANTRADGEEFLRLASRLGVRPEVTEYAFEDLDTAMSDLAEGRLAGSAVLRVSS
jgi:propanol-preferring alcohol dehydrogenase